MKKENTNSEEKQKNNYNILQYSDIKIFDYNDEKIIYSMIYDYFEDMQAERNQKQDQKNYLNLRTTEVCFQKVNKAQITKSSTDLSSIGNVFANEAYIAQEPIVYSKRQGQAFPKTRYIQEDSLCTSETILQTVICRDQNLVDIYQASTNHTNVLVGQKQKNNCSNTKKEVLKKSKQFYQTRYWNNLSNFMFNKIDNYIERSVKQQIPRKPQSNFYTL